MADQSAVAVYKGFTEADDAVRQLHRAGIPIEKISIIGKDWQVREDVQGFYTPKDAVKEGAAEGAWLGGLFGMLLGAAFFLVPAVGPVVILGPLAGMLAGAIGGAGIGALVSALVAMGIPKEEAIKYQARIEAGEFLVVVNGTPQEVENAREILRGTSQTEVNTHTSAASPGSVA
jgi:uncharacterized membrane protein